MKILLITDTIINKIDELICRTRYELFTYLLYKYLIKKDVEVVFSSLCPIGRGICMRHKSVRALIPTVDHIIVVENYALHCRDSHYLERLKDCCRGVVCTLNMYNKWYAGEDVMFYLLSNTVKRYNSVHIGPINCPDLLFVNKSKELFNVLIDDPDKMKEYLTLYSNGNKETIIKSIDGDKMSYQSTQYSSDEVNYKYFIKFTDRYEEYSKTDIYIITRNVPDEYTLYELSMCNVLIVANKKFILPQLKNKYDILTYDYQPPTLSVILNKLKKFNVRERLIKEKNNEGETGLKIIYEFLLTHKMNPDKKINQISTTKKKINRKPTFHQIMEKLIKPEIINKIEIEEKIKKEKQAPKPPRRLLIQSELHKYIQ